MGCDLNKIDDIISSLEERKKEAETRFSRVLGNVMRIPSTKVDEIDP